MSLWRNHRIIGNVVVGSLVGIFLVLMVATTARTGEIVSAIRQTQQINTTTNQDTHHTVKLVESCVKPTGRCFKRGQRRTAGAVANINRVVILAAACAVGQHGTVQQVQNAIQTCVIERLAADQRGSR